MLALARNLERTPRPRLLAAGFGFLAAVGIADYLTGYNLSFSAFYLLDIGFVAWFLGCGWALALALLGIAVSIGGDWAAGAHYATIFVPIWNALILAAVYATALWLTGSLRAAHSDLERRIAERTRELTHEIQARERLEKEILEVSERERQRIGHDLHDGLCQHLTATAMAAQVLAQKLEARAISESAAAGELVQLIAQGTGMARNMAHGIAPLEMEPEGLVTALRTLADNVSRLFKVECRVECESPPPVNDAAAAIHLYRIAQEAVNNALRHGKPRQIIVSLVRVRQRVQLTVEDDGAGLPEHWQSARGLGTRIMAHRASLIGGTVCIDANPTGGTLVTCSLPAQQAG
jgi:signal transduction histidine kinase